MNRPWQLPHRTREHHACPLGGGWWRGPAARTGLCERALGERGIRTGPPLPDGSQRFRIGRETEWPDGREAAGDPDEPRDRAAWITARLLAARAAFHAPLPRPRWMAVVNLTPDSFSDAGLHEQTESVAASCERARDERASWIDLGAESTRPGAAGVEPEHQLERLLPALEVARATGVPVSIDTRSARVARRCLERGAGMINDVSAFADPEMGAVAAEHDCPVVLMHMRGEPADMMQRTGYRFLLGEVVDELAARVERARGAGVRAERLWIDPGIGFAKGARQSLELIGRLGAFRSLGLPVLVGPSRKSFMAEVLEGKPAPERDGGTAGAAALCAAQGASMLRLHRGGASWDAVRVAWAAASEAHAASAAAVGIEPQAAEPVSDGAAPTAEEARP